MMYSEQNERILYEAFHSFGETVKSQNKVIGFILGGLLIASIILFCILII